MTEQQTPDRVPFKDMLDTLTGWDEVAIAKRFDGFDPVLQGGTAPMRAMRTLVFVQERREGHKDPEAYETAMGLTMRQLQDYFPEDPDDEIDPDAPETELGNGDSSDD